MDGHHFDRWTRSLAARSSRRRILAMLLGGVALWQGEDDGVAGPGCKNVGKPCQKKKDCCSGICKGKRGRKKCKGHDGGSCQAGQGLEHCPGNPVDDCVTSGGSDGHCWTTTGNAAYCGGPGGCISCQRDADCRIYCGPDAACVRCAQCNNPERTACMGTTACDFAP